MGISSQHVVQSIAGNCTFNLLLFVLNTRPEERSNWQDCMIMYYPIKECIRVEKLVKKAIAFRVNQMTASPYSSLS